MKVTIKDVAALAGVSFKTVSRVVNKELSVSEVLRGKVEKAIQELDYKPNQSARTLRGSVTSIALIYQNPNSNYIIDIQSGVLACCKKQCYELVIHPCESASQYAFDELVELVDRTRVGGLILTPPFSEDVALIQKLAAKQIQFVRILSGSSAPDDFSPCVFVDDCKAGFEITEHLIELGHKKIGFLGGEEEHESSGNRYRGYNEALEKHNIPAYSTLVVGGGFSFESGVERTRALIQKTHRPTAIFAANDEIAAGALFAARLMGVSVPEELSIVGFEDSPFSRQTWPKLTTARQPNKIIAETAADFLISRIRTTKDEKPELGVAGFYPEVVVRDSTCPPNDH